MSKYTRRGKNRVRLPIDGMEKMLIEYLSKQTFDGEPFHPSRVIEMARAAVKVMGTCILCGNSSVCGGIFVPDKPWNYGNPTYVPGKTRYLFYGLCQACFDLPDSIDRIEANMKV